MRTHEEAASGKESFSLISDEKLLMLYSTMLKCRMIERRLRLRDESASGGHEAAAVGATIDLLQHDSVHASPLGRTGRLVQGAMLKAWVSAAVVEDGLPEATAKAAKHRSQKQGALAVVLASKDGRKMGAWKKALREAGKDRLPVLFVALNSQKAKTPAGSRTGSDAMMDLAQAHDLPGIIVDGNDVVAVYRVASEAIAHARKGNGPTLIDCQSWQLDGVPEGNHADPIDNMERYLEGKGLFRQGLRSSIEDEIEAAFVAEASRAG